MKPIKKSDLIITLFIFVIFGVIVWVSLQTYPVPQKLELSQLLYPSYVEIFPPGTAKAIKAFYVKEIPSAEIFPKFLNFLAEKYCPTPKSKYPVCVINVYKVENPYEVCMNPMTDDQECESLLIGHWDNFPQPVRYFKDSSGNKIQF
jgi:hypothetical protein